MYKNAIKNVDTLFLYEWKSVDRMTKQKKLSLVSFVIILVCGHHVDYQTQRRAVAGSPFLSPTYHIHTYIVGMFGSWRPVAQVGLNSWVKQLLSPQKFHKIYEKRDWLAWADRASGNFRSCSFFAEYFHIVSDTNKLVVLYAKKSGKTVVFGTILENEQNCTNSARRISYESIFVCCMYDTSLTVILPSDNDVSHIFLSTLLGIIVMRKANMYRDCSLFLRV